MRKIRETLRLRLEAGLSYRQISACTKVSVGAIQKLLSRAQALALSWPLPDDLDDEQLARLIYPNAVNASQGQLQEPDWPALHQQLRHKGVTRHLLWEEYTECYPNSAYSYSQFCERYQRWLKRQRRSMRQAHKAGEKCFIDYAGQTVPVVNPQTGEIREAQIFIAVLGASSYTFVEATWTQSLPEWLQSHVHALEFFQGCPALLVPDNLKSGVHQACRYDPDINPSYQQFAEHYQTAVLPARPRRPRDKAKVEVGVQIVERWLLARLRHQTFFSLAELNHCLKTLLTALNEKPFKQRPGCRREAFEQIDRPALRPLPTHPYRYVDIRTVKVNIDYHVLYETHLYSVPHQYVGERLELHASHNLIQLYFRRHPVASHPRHFTAGITTDPGHMPERHRAHQRWTPARLKHWAAQIGPDTLQWITQRLDEKDHPEQAYRLCLGLLNLSRQYPAHRLNATCRLANREGLTRLRQLRSILKSNRDQLQQDLPLSPALPQDHENLRGPTDFH